jgi:Metallo-beta-lactamase superfamily
MNWAMAMPRRYVNLFRRSIPNSWGDDPTNRVRQRRIVGFRVRTLIRIVAVVPIRFERSSPNRRHTTTKGDPEMTPTTQPPIPHTTPVQIAPETFLIPNLAPAEPGTYVPVNSLLIRGREPIVVDTGAPVHRERVLEMIFSLVDPSDIRWIFLSHDDGDHTGALHEILDAAPRASLVTNFFSTERLALERAIPMHRSIWREPGETFHAGDRTLRLFLPPIFDGPTTRGIYDDTTGVMWIVDSFAALTTGAVHHVEDLPSDLYDESFMLFNSLVSPWHQFLDPVAYGRHVSSVETFGPRVVASAHGPVLRGDAIGRAFTRVATLAGQPRLMAGGQELLDEILASAQAA